MATKITKDELNKRVFFMGNMFRGYRETNNQIMSEVIDESVKKLGDRLKKPMTPDSLLEDYETRRRQWTDLKARVIKRNKELTVLEDGLFSKIPSWTECRTEKWTWTTGTQVYEYCTDQLKETVKGWEEVRGNSAKLATIKPSQTRAKA